MTVVVRMAAALRSDFDRITVASVGSGGTLGYCACLSKHSDISIAHRLAPRRGPDLERNAARPTIDCGAAEHGDRSDPAQITIGSRQNFSHFWPKGKGRSAKKAAAYIYNFYAARFPCTTTDPQPQPPSSSCAPPPTDRIPFENRRWSYRIPLATVSESG